MNFNLFKKFTITIFKYFSVFIPITILILAPIYLYGDELGLFLIDTFGPVIGLFIRPIVIAIIPIIVFSFLHLSLFNKFNELISLNKVSIQQMHSIYKSYIYSLGSFILLTLAIIFKTLFISHTYGVNWYSARNFIFIYLISVCLVTPIFHVLNLRKS